MWYKDKVDEQWHTGVTVGGHASSVEDLDWEPSKGKKIQPYPCLLERLKLLIRAFKGDNVWLQTSKAMGSTRNQSQKI